MDTSYVSALALKTNIENGKQIISTGQLAVWLNWRMISILDDKCQYLELVHL